MEQIQTMRWLGSSRDFGKCARVRSTLELAWGDFLGRIPWELFVTLTFDPKRVFPVREARAEKEMFQWCCQLEFALRRPVASLIAVERGRSGQWHGHVLLAGVPSDISPLPALWELRNGRISVKPVHAIEGIVLYATKEAALSGNLVLSEAVGRYREHLVDHPVVALYR